MKEPRPVAKCCCSYCHKKGHTRRNCPERTAVDDRKAAWNGECAECADLPWRRELPSCPGCGGYYAPEAPVTIDEIMSRAAEDRRSIPL